MPDLQMAHQTSRLDRLLTLLDTGSTPATRRAAARQIGDIAKLHCGELRPVLRKVRQFLRSHKWETRVAAAQAVGAIAENVKHISVKELIALAEEELAKAGFTGVFRKTPETGLLKTKSSASLGFSSFDIQRVLEHGASLLASGGQEFDVPVDTTKTPAERLALQKQGLNKRLGLDVCERFMDMNDIIVDEDLVVQKVSSSGNGDTSPCGSHSRSKVKQEVHELVARMVPNNLSRTLSARERNKLKRKAKVVVRDGSKEWGDEDEAGEPHAKRARSTKSVMTEQSQGSSKLVVESVLDEDASDFNTGGQWPFEYFVELLIHDIFDPVWELRHGSMMALREILSAQAGSAAVVAPVFDAKIESSTISPNGTQATTAGKQVEIDLNLDFVADEEILDIKDVKECVTRLKQETCEKDAVFRMPETPIRVEPKHEQDFVEGTSGTVKVESLGMLKPEWDLNLEVKCEADLKKLDSSSSNQEEPWCLVDEALFGQMPKESRALKVVTAAEQAWGSNLEFLQDCTIRLLCIFALDRFGDFVSDQVVAPVRETCAQALGAVLKQMPPLLVHETLNVLLQMQGRPEWEVRHGSLLGIKYMVAVRQEMLAELLPRVLPACMAGLEDRDDDVRAVAAEALTPAAVAIASSAGKAVSSILLSLWEILLDLDDLSPSTSSAMNLLAELYSQPESITKPPAEHIGRPVLDLNEEIEPFESGVGSSNSVSARDPFLLATLAPRLWPFMRHNISSVRHAAIRTFERLLESGGQSGSERCSWAVPILGDALQLVFQNLLLETHEDILHCSERVWRLLLKCPQHDLATAATTYFSAWLKLASTAIGTPLETSKLFCHFKSTFQKSRLKSDGKSKLVKASPSAPAQNSELSMGATSVRVIVGADGEKSVVHMRVTTSLALGILAASLPQSVLDTVVDALSGLLASNSSVQRQVAAMVLVSWFQEIGRKADGEKVQNVEGAQRLRLTILELLSANDAAMPSPGSALPYIELSKTYEKMRNEAGALVRHAETLGIAGLPAVERMTAEQAISLVMKLDIPSADASQEEKPASNSDFLVIARQRLLATAGYLKCLQSNMHISVLASLAGAVVWMGVLPTKLNPVIQPLMAAVKREQAEILQQPASFALAEVIGQCVGRKPSPNDKLIKNLCALTCADPMETPQASTVNADNLLYANGANQSGKAQTDEKSKNQAVNSAEERAKLEGAISRHGAELAFKALSVKFGDDLFEKLPKLWDGITEALGQVDTGAGHSQSTTGNNQRITPAAEPQALINNLQVVRSICPALSKTLQMELLTLLPAIFSCVHHQHAAVRLSAARCLTSMARTMTEPVMAGVLAEAVPMLRDTSSIHARQGAGMLVTALVEGLGSELVPYAPLLIVPLLGCMSDSNEYVRQSVTHSFATLVPLLPLARGMPSPRGLDDGQALRRAEDTRFLEQLLDNSQVDDYTLRVPLSVTLRRYQQEGINWLAFLKRFKLHGILCDDMGLGKTLQASAIVASDTAEQVAALGLSGKTDGSVWPSLIVCPSTLVGHWAFEIEKFIEKKFLNPLQYIGSPQDRLLLRSRLHEHNVVITSYDVLRKDVEFLSQQLWNYCVLDEGHVIKSAKSKITLAAKRIQAEHRLILSGTPIQNNVLELWSLFDFLMPGFLGTERQFYAMYGKPLSAAREAKCSGKDTEAGILAMEALHKQVMPFLLRRTKDEVLADLPPKIIQDRYCDMSPLQLRLYEDFSKSQVKKQVGSEAEAYLQDAAHVPSSSGSQPTHVFQALQYLKKLCSHPLLVLDESPPEYVASIISAPHSRDTMAPLHELHHAPKLLALQEILEECGIGPSTSAGEACLVGEGGQHRVLIFAQFKAFLDIIEKDLFQAHMKGVTYLRLDGSVDTDKRFEIVKTFNSDPTIDVLLLTTHVGGLGLNLTAADTVVFMEHDWNPMRDLQAMDRAHRLGQRRVVNVHRLIMRGTLEEKVMSLQQFKMSIFNNVITAENVSLSKMDTTRLLDLFTVSAESGKAKAAGRSSTEVDAEGAEAAGAPGGGKGLKALLNGLDELWDQSQYTEEYNLSQFLTRLNN